MRILAGESHLAVSRPPIHHCPIKWCILVFMARTNIDVDDSLIRKARRLTHLKTKREIVHRSLELLVRTEARKGILSFYGSGVWKGNLKRSRKNRT